MNNLGTSLHILLHIFYGFLLFLPKDDYIPPSQLFNYSFPYIWSLPILVCLLLSCCYDKTQWPKVTCGGRNSFFDFVFVLAYSCTPLSKGSWRKNSRQEPEGKNRSRGHGRTLFTGLFSPPPQLTWSVIITQDRLPRDGAAHGRLPPPHQSLI